MSLGEILKRLKNGEKIKCHICNKGVLKPCGAVDLPKARSFKCDKCGECIVSD